LAGNVITTGSAEMDKKMGGGLPLGSLTLVEGDSDAGKSVLVQQLTWGALEEGRRVTLYTCENTTRSLMRQMESIGLDVTDHLLLGRLRTFVLPLTGADKLEVLRRLPSHVGSEPGEFFVVDSATTFLQESTDDDVMSFFTACKAQCDLGKTVVIVLHAHGVSDTAMMRLRSMSDAHLRLRIEEVGDKLIKILEVAKIRGAAKATGNIISFNVEPGLGMRIIPVSKAKA
jgi:flagellar protein FlaH